MQTQGVFKEAELYREKSTSGTRYYIAYAYLNPDTGKFQRFKKYLSKKLLTKTAIKQHARIIIEQINHDLQNGWSPFERESTLFKTTLAAVQYALQYKLDTCRKTSVIAYRSVARRFMRWLNTVGLASKPISFFSVRDAVMFSDYLRTLKLAPRSYNNNIQYCRNYFNFLVERGYTRTNPFKSIKYMPVPESNPTPILPAEMDRLKEYLWRNDPDLWFSCQLLYYCFLRPAEQTRLLIRNIELDKRRFKVPAEFSKVKKNRFAAIPDVFFQTFPKCKLLFDPNDQLFSTQLKPGKKIIKPTRIANRFQKVRELLGLEHIKPYDFKHTGAGKLLDCGVDIHSMMLQLGHKNLETTQIYLDKFKNEPSEALRINFPPI